LKRWQNDVATPRSKENATMKIVSFYEMAPDALPRVMPLFPEHRTRLEEFHARGVLIAAGPLGNPPEGAMAIFTTREAAEAFEREIRLQPGLVAAHFSLGLARVDLDENARAIAAFRSVLRLEPGHAPARFNLALTLLAAGDRAGAREEQKALEPIDPNLALQLALRLDGGRD